MGNICWLASYPKSGNTWLRILLENYHSNSDRPVDINALNDFGGSSRLLFDEWAGIRSSALDADTIDELLPAVYRCVAREEAGPLFFKTHNMFRKTRRGEALFPPDVSTGAVYILRNVLDVATSLARHGGYDVGVAVQKLCDVTNVAARSEGRLDDQLRQVLGSWGTHAISWLDQQVIPVHLVRYEDLLLNPVEVFAAVVRFLGLPFDQERVQRAVAFSSFEELRRQEIGRGFRERPEEATAPFFRRGQASAWRTELRADMIQRLTEAHGELLRRFQYVQVSQ